MIYIIIPAYNEEKRIGKTLEEYAKYFEHMVKMKKIDEFEIVVVINNTRDGTEKIVNKLGQKFREIKYLNFKEGGKGFAVHEGFKECLRKSKSDKDLIGFVDADNATKADSFYELVRNVNGYDGIIASRWIKGAIVKTKQTVLRRITSRGFNIIARTLFFMPYRDTQCGAKLFQRRALQKINDQLKVTNWAWDIELLYELRKYGSKVKEQPTVWEDKTDSKLNIRRVPLVMFLALLRLRLLNSPFKGIIRLYDKLPEKLKIHHRIK